MTDYLDETQPTISNLAGNSKYGDVTPGGGSEDQTDLFSLFKTPRANTYYITVDVLVPYGKDQFPWNNTMTMEFRIFDTFFLYSGLGACNCILASGTGSRPAPDQ